MVILSCHDTILPSFGLVAKELAPEETKELRASQKHCWSFWIVRVLLERCESLNFGSGHPLSDVHLGSEVYVIGLMPVAMPQTVTSKYQDSRV